MEISTAQWAAKLSGVCDASLAGSADLDYWRERLEQEGLAPIEVDGRAQALIIAADARFKGIRFRELSLSIQARPLGGPASAAGAFLVQAFNSNRLFAWCERRLFYTPYLHGRVRVSAAVPASIDLAVDGPTAFHAEMFAPPPGAPPRTPVRAADDGWEGPVYLPARAAGGRGKMFFGRVRGFTETYQFLPEDWFSVTRAACAFEHLLASNFVPALWLLRPAAAHAKSKTYPREA